MAYAAVISVKRIIENLMYSPRISLAPSSQQIIKFAHQELKSMQEILERLDETSKSYSRKKVNALDSRIKEVVWKFEDLFESNVSTQILPQSEIDGGGAALLKVDLLELGEDVDSFAKLLKKMEEEYIYELDHPSLEESSPCAASSTTDSDAEKSKIVGSSDLLIEIKEKLKPYPYFSVIPIVGMAGIGKTTLAKHIFDDAFNFSETEKYLFEFGFDCRAWITIGRSYQLNQLKRDILLQLDADMEKSLMGGDEEHDLGTYLNKILKAKRCLIVLDDVWDNDIWDNLKSYLPEEARSRVLLTTRLRHVAKYVDQRWHAVIYTIQLLNKDESWDLLRERVFGEELCPPELERDGKKIAENCDGLPLMIVTVAESLSKADRTAEYWKYVAEKKTCSIFMDAYEQLSEVLFPSYEYLPQHLKPCFLHMGVFPQNYEIPRRKILGMWIAERFVDPNLEQTLEECAQSYLGELLYHNVVMRCQASTNFAYEIADDVKTCRLHSSFWYLCYKEATKNKFFHVLSSPADVLEERMRNQRRLSVHNNILFGINEVEDSIEDACASTARSLLCYGPIHPFQVPISFNFRLLRVLDALQIRFYEFPIQVIKLIHLRYFAMTCNSKLPPSISKLLNLEYLIIHRYMTIKSQGDPSYVPLEIWDMKGLKHIQIMGSNMQFPSGRDSMGSLLELINVSAETCTKEVLERISNLRKLRIQIELHPDDDMKALHCVNHIDVLSELRSLTCIIVNPKLRPEIVSLPAPLSMFSSGLEKLHLSGLGYPWEYMSIIASLPKLEVLKLRCYAFRGPKWEVKGGGYHLSRLRYLLIEDTDLVQFRVEFGGFPWLGSLCLKNCYKLKDLQWDTYSYPSKIEVTDCSPSTVSFANEMRTRGEYYPKKPKEVFIHSSWEDRNLN